MHNTFVSAITVGTPQSPKSRPTENIEISCDCCGYSLRGLASSRCESCGASHLHCPECGHHQQIGTLFFAQRAMNRLQFFYLTISAALRAALLMYGGWCVSFFSNEFCLMLTRKSSFFQPPDPAMIFATVLWAIGLGVVGRLILVRWSNSVAVGLVLAHLTFIAALIGMGWFVVFERPKGWSPLWDHCFVLVVPACGVFVGSTFALALWSDFVRCILPSSSAKSLLAWQQSLSED